MLKKLQYKQYIINPETSYNVKLNLVDLAVYFRETQLDIKI